MENKKKSENVMVNGGGQRRQVIRGERDDQEREGKQTREKGGGESREGKKGVHGGN